MGKPACSDEDFVALFEEFGPHETSRRLEQAVAGVFARRSRLEKKLCRAIISPENRSGRVKVEYPHRIELSVITGTVLVGSDAHYWPGESSTAHKAFVHFSRKLKPAAVIINGDALDGAKISRHPPIGWEKRPTLVEEIECVKERLAEILRATPFRSCRRIWTLGNHDARFETRLATVAPEYAELHGVHLKDHFPDWHPAWSVWINDSVVVKHRFKGGIHAPHNNTMWAGKTIITGHLHSAKVTPYTDYNGHRYGVDAGCLADPDHPAFTDYTEDNPKNWRSGFVVLTFQDGRLLQPELVLAWGKDQVQFRGEIVNVG